MHKLAILTVILDKSGAQKFFESLSDQTDKDFHLYIADYSNDIDADALPLRNVTVLKRENRGYAYGINEGIRQAQKDGIRHFCVINDDTYFEKDFVTQVKRAGAARRGAITGGTIYYADGHEYHTERYTKSELGKVIWYAGGTVDWAHAQTGHRGVDEVDAGQFNSAEQTQFITGCLMIFDSVVIEKIGYLDESYFLYFEDADYCERAKRAGIKLYYDPSVKIWHLVSHTTGGSGSALQVQYQRRNTLRFALKYAPFRTRLHVLKNYFFPQSER